MPLLNYSEFCMHRCISCVIVVKIYLFTKKFSSSDLSLELDMHMLYTKFNGPLQIMSYK